MVNLYQILHLSPQASETEIRFALQQMRSQLDSKTISAIEKWLLVPNVRTRYDEKLRETYPDFFRQPERKVKQIQPEIVEEVEEELPPLWNPSAACNWAIMFLPIAPVLHAQNWKALEEERLALYNWIWSVVFFILMFIAITFDWLSKKIPFPFLYGLLPLILWYFLLGRKQIRFFKEELDNDYEKRGWSLPILLSIGIFIAMSALSMGLILLFVSSIKTH
ncbi:hypothetical protein ACKLNO_04840 [Neisseriaceae bacterium B1]